MTEKHPGLAVVKLMSDKAQSDFQSPAELSRDVSRHHRAVRVNC